MIKAKSNKHLRELVADDTVDLEDVDVSKITNMSYLFQDLTIEDDISKWDTSKVTNMEGIFQDATVQCDTGDWFVAKVTKAADMFFNANMPRIAMELMAVEINMQNQFYSARATVDLPQKSDGTIGSSRLQIFIENKLEFISRYKKSLKGYFKDETDGSGSDKGILNNMATNIPNVSDMSRDYIRKMYDLVDIDNIGLYTSIFELEV